MYRLCYVDIEEGVY